jgi:hypothetical protein
VEMLISGARFHDAVSELQAAGALPRESETDR